MGYEYWLDGKIKSDKPITDEHQVMVMHEVFDWAEKEAWSPTTGCNSWYWWLSDEGIESPEDHTKYYEMIPDLEALIAALAKLGYVLNGEVFVDGEESGDHQKIEVVNNKVEHKTGRIVYD